MPVDIVFDHVYIVAPRAARIEAATKKLNMSAEDAAAAVDKTDEGRRRYVKTYYDRKWDWPADYHLVLNSDTFAYEQCADLIVNAVEARGWVDE